MDLHTILMIAASVAAAVASGGIAGVPILVAGIAGVVSVGLGTAAAAISHGAGTKAAADAAVVAAVQHAADTLPSAHAAQPTLRAALAVSDQPTTSA